MARRLLNPFILSLLVFGFQFLCWWLWMPEDSVLQGRAPRFESATSYVRYAVFLAVWLQAILLGMVLARLFLRRQRDTDNQSPPLLDLTYLERVALVTALLALVGELVYARNLLQNPGLVIEAFRSGAFFSIGEQAGQEKIVGLSSLNNLFVIPAAVYAIMWFAPTATARQRTRGRRWVLWLGAVVLLHAFLFVGRQLFLTYILIVLGAYLLLRHGRYRLSARVVFTIAVLVVAAVWLGETTRSGQYFATQERVGLFSAETQNYVFRRLVEGYMASDLNNTFRLLSCSSPMEPLNSTMWSTPAAALGVPVTEYWDCDLWVSFEYNTNQVFGSWWWDADWMGLVSAIVIGGWLGLVYILATRKNAGYGFITVLFLLSFPSVISMLRVNYFGMTLFQLPAFVLLLAWFLRPRARTAHQREPRSVASPTRGSMTRIAGAPNR